MKLFYCGAPDQADRGRALSSRVGKRPGSAEPAITPTPDVRRRHRALANVRSGRTFACRRTPVRKACSVGIRIMRPAVESTGYLDHNGGAVSAGTRMRPWTVSGDRARCEGRCAKPHHGTPCGNPVCRSIAESKSTRSHRKRSTAQKPVDENCRGVKSRRGATAGCRAAPGDQERPASGRAKSANSRIKLSTATRSRVHPFR